ncbi:MAG: hypothetical protein JXA57_15020 [Armatimonadetes bacterium]|nr:hypothetical protein [Armatimonadota bacterium]
MKKTEEMNDMAKEAILSCLSGAPFVEVTRLDFEPSQYEMRPDMLVELALPDGQALLVVELKDSGQPRIARAAVEQIARAVRMFPRAYGVLMAPFISPASDAICRESNIGYVDFAGNCRLSFWPIHIERQGRPNPFAKRRASTSLFSPKATRVLRVLLCEPKRSWRVVDLAGRSGVSMGSVSKVRRLLAEREWADDARGALRLTRPLELLSQWASNYDRRRDIALDFYCLKSVPEIESGLIEICSDAGATYAFTEFSGGARLAPAVRYQRVTAYASREAIETASSVLGMKGVTSGPNVTLIDPYDAGVYYGASEIDGANVVSDIQAYLDLRQLRGRGEEAAEAILRRVIEPRWQ